MADTVGVGCAPPRDGPARARPPRWDSAAARGRGPAQRFLKKGVAFMRVRKLNGVGDVLWIGSPLTVLP